jgi:hypothetical protein
MREIKNKNLVKKRTNKQKIPKPVENETPVGPEE